MAYIDSQMVAAEEEEYLFSLIKFADTFVDVANSFTGLPEHLHFQDDAFLTLVISQDGKYIVREKVYRVLEELLSGEEKRILLVKRLLINMEIAMSTWTGKKNTPVEIQKKITNYDKMVSYWSAEQGLLRHQNTKTL
jgi:uncharacterized protein YlzI (FlbEa/FlbD family)